MVGGFVPVRAVAAGTEQIAQPIVRKVPEPTSNAPRSLNVSGDGVAAGERRQGLFEWLSTKKNLHKKP
jgi:hypothetical protein